MPEMTNTPPQVTAPEIVKRNKALAVSPLKASSTLGATLAFLGMNRCLPMLHGSQGCTAYGKIFFIQHFREPMPLQTDLPARVLVISIENKGKSPAGLLFVGM